MKKRILKTLLIEPDSKSAVYLAQLMASNRCFDIHLESANNPDTVLTLIQSKYFDLFLVADLLPPDNTATLISALTEMEPESPIIFLCEKDDEKSGLKAIRAGASDFIAKRRIPDDNLNHCLSAALERAVRERNFRQAFANIKTLCNSAREGVALMRNGLVFEANQMFSSLFGYKPAQVIGFPVSRFINCESLKSEKDDFFYLDNGSFFEGEGIKKDGTRLAVEFKGETTRFNGKTIQVFIVRDCTSRHVRLPIGDEAAG